LIKQSKKALIKTAVIKETSCPACNLESQASVREAFHHTPSIGQLTLGVCDFAIFRALGYLFSTEPVQGFLPRCSVIRNDLDGLLVAVYALVKCTLHGIGMATVGTGSNNYREWLLLSPAICRQSLMVLLCLSPRESRSLCRRELELYRLQGSSIGDNICCLRWIPRAPCFGT
jgi:hypothetical protein